MTKYERTVFKLLWKGGIYIIGLLFGLGYYTYNLQREALQSEIDEGKSGLKEVKEDFRICRERIIRIETLLEEILQRKR